MNPLAHQNNLEIRYNAPLTAYHTFRTGAKANAIIEIHQQEDWKELITLAKESNSEIMVLGEGSNILFTKDHPYWVAINKVKGCKIVQETEKYVDVEFAGGEIWHDCVEWAVEQNYGGIENLALIPGTIGAAPIQNIGAYGVELKDVFRSLEAVSLTDARTKTFDYDACSFGYRDSIFKQELKGQYVITKVCLRLTKQPVVNTDYKGISNMLHQMQIKNPTIKDVFDAVVSIRNTKLPNPKEIYNAGSFFKNPVVSKSKYNSLRDDHPSIVAYPVGDNNYKIPAAWLLEKAGWKGKRRGDAGFYAKHALVLVNYGNASGDELKNLAWDALDDVFKKFGVLLKPEVWVF